MKNKFFVLSIITSIIIFSTPVLAHVTLSPNEAVGGYQTYLVNVPNERDNPTIQLRLVVPDGVDIMGIYPVRGWNYTTKTVPVQPQAGGTTQQEGMDNNQTTERITEITWFGGQIQPGEFMQFPISTRYDGDPATLTWKAYQTYASGEIVAWADPSGATPAPKVIILNSTRVDTLTNLVNQQQTTLSQISQQLSQQANSQQFSIPTYLAGGAFVLSFIAVVLSLKGKRFSSKSGSE